MSTSRLQLTQVVADKSLKSGATKKLAQEVAAYLLVTNKVAELDPLMRDVWAAYSDKGYIEAIAISAHPLSAKALTDIKSMVRNLYPAAKQIIVTTQSDPRVMGGIRLELPHQQLDLTVEAKLDQFKQLTNSQIGQAS